MSGIIAPIVGLPGVRAQKTSIHKAIFRGGITGFLPGGKLLSGTSSRDPTNVGYETNLQAGLIIGKRTADGLYAPSIIGPTTVANAVGHTSVTVGVGTAAELNRRVGASGTFKLTGPPAAGAVVNTVVVTYSAINLTTGVITVTALTFAAISGSFVQPSDGSEQPVTLLPDGWALPVANLDGSVQSVVQLPLVPIDGVIDTTQVINYPTDTSLQAWVKAGLCGLDGGRYIFSDRY